ncbi:ABC transporter ATP-binding protein [Rhizobium sp. FY34]|uniref:ABC transporter ATP-binding protein n=1 Tax=Rhizobium sp. FY34 TaxID=2562309 RepID=UPI0010C06C1C|nr:ABC transporter ATP-binding protein [Rhizobium sp. FY34]
MSGISLRNIRKAYPGGPTVLHDVSMEFHPGEFIVIVGPSGCGKSTLLRLIAGLERPDAGEIEIAGIRANDLAPQDRDIAMIFQNYALYPHMSVRENIAFGLELRGMPKAERNRRAQEVARMLQLEPYLERKPGALSGGQRQRVAMGRAMARNTSTFLMDEPLSNLDNALRIAMRTEIKELHRQLGATIVYVTHDQTEALSLADRVAVMKDGHLQQFDRPDVIYDRPANRFVASFLGVPPINFVAAEKLPGWQGMQGLTAGLRPDILKLHAQRPARPSLEARLVLSEMTGSDLLLHCDSAAGRLTVTAPRREVTEQARQLWISYDLDRALFFDNDSGERVDLARDLRSISIVEE